MSINRNRNKKRTNLGKTLKTYALGIGAIGVIGTTTLDRLDDYLLDPKDFEEARWEQIYNGNGIIWDDYIKQKIPHNTFNWHAYIKEVRERNNGKLEGKIYVPIFDDKN